MGDREDFLDWFGTTWSQAEDALHAGDAGPRFRTWSEREPVTLFGAWFNAVDAAGARLAFQRLAQTFSRAGSSSIDLIACEVSGDLAYTVHRELTAAAVDGVSREYVLRVTQVYRREDGEWRVVHRHGDADPDTEPDR
jgi:ketosteroid isomerase-like protein